MIGLINCTVLISSSHSI